MDGRLPQLAPPLAGDYRRIPLAAVHRDPNRSSARAGLRTAALTRTFDRAAA
jgi:hypothetical protein